MAISAGAAIVGGASIIGGVLGAKGAGDAADAQVESAELGIAEQRAARESFEERAQPFVDLGTGASAELASFLGISPNPERAAIDAQIAALQSQSGSRSPLRDDDISSQIAALRTQKEGLPQFTQGDRMGQLEEINPLVNFLRDQGFESIQESAAASGRLGAGGTLKDLTSFNTNLASTIVPQLQNQRFNQLFNTAGLGSNAASGVGTAGMNSASNIANLQGASGAAQAGGIVGQTNALTGAISNVAGAAGAFPNLFGGGGNTVPAKDVVLPNAGVTAPTQFAAF